MENLSIQIVPITQVDYTQWLAYWLAYQEFYQVSLPSTVTQTTWQRF